MKSEVEPSDRILAKKQGPVDFCLLGWQNFGGALLFEELLYFLVALRFISIVVVDGFILFNSA